MGLHISSNLMWSDDATEHTASEQDGTWHVSWLPGRTLTHSEAVSAMQIAVTVGGSAEPGDLRFLHVEGWSAELGLAPAEAIMLVSKPPAGTAG